MSQFYHIGGRQHGKTHALHLEIARLMAKHKEEWLDRQAKQHFPPVIYCWAKEKRNLPFVCKWIERQGYHQRFHPGGNTEFCRGETVLATYEPPQIFPKLTPRQPFGL